MGIRVDWKKLVPGFLKIGVQAGAGNLVGVITGAIDTASAFSWDGPAAPTAEEGARLLLQRATYTAATRAIARYARHALTMAVEADPREIEAAISGRAAGAGIELTGDAFAHPERWTALDTMAAGFERWQAACQVPEDVRAPMLRAFRDEFPLALLVELRDDAKAADYAALLAELRRETPVDAAAERARQWMDYRARLVAVVNRPLRSLDPVIPPYSLSDLYIPLRAAIADRGADRARRGAGEEAEGQRRIVWLHEALEGWIAAPSREDTIRVVSGDPGAGKSSACAMLAADLARQGRRVLLVPLGRLDYNGDPWGELSRSIREELGHDALDGLRADTGEPLVLILDGLDELAKAGQGAAEIVGQFVGGLERRVNDANRNDIRLLLLLAGRPGAASATGTIARADGARLEVLRYVVEDQHQFTDESRAAIDQRENWWRRFDPAQGMPVVLAGQDRRLSDLTAQPLLNWLLAQVLTLEGVEKAATITGVHDLYNRLFDHVLLRTHRERRSEASDAVERERLEWMLEEAAVAVWHRGERTVPLPAVIERLEAAGLDADLDRITRDRDSALTTLLDSFFCRAHSGVEHRVVEFTHKSFAEFLTARRLVREITEMHDLMNRKRNRHTTDAALSAWLALCGPAAMDYDLFDMLGAEVAAFPAEEVAGWRRTLTALFQECVQAGMPWPGTAEERARAAERRVRNAEVALLAALNATVRKAFAEGDQSLVSIDWSAISAAETLHRLLGPMQSWTVGFFSLTGFDLYGTYLAQMDLSGANLSGANLSHSNLTGANLSHTYLTGANLTGVDVSDANLSHASLTGANLTGANLAGADLSYADLSSAAPIAANLSHTDLSRANLSGVDLRGANLRNADLSGAFLSNVNLSRADLRGANLRDVYGMTEKEHSKLLKRVRSPAS